MNNVSATFEILPAGAPIPFGQKNSSGQLIWDVKIDFTKKSRWVKDGHHTPEPKEKNYAGVVSRDSVIIALNHSALNDVTAASIQNAYLQAPYSEKQCVICGKEFGL